MLSRPAILVLTQRASLRCFSTTATSCTAAAAASTAPTAPSSSKPPPQNHYDVAVVGGGIVGLATARELLLRHPKLKMVVLEKERELSMHQSGHNSGVIHAGIYYTPGSLKAKLCLEGLHSAYKYCDEKSIPYKKCGKLIVAVEEHELSKLEDLRVRGEKNNVPDLRMIEAKEIPEIEPNCRGLRALHSPHTGIVDWRVVALSYARDFEQLGGRIITQFEVNNFQEASEHSTYPVRITCATAVSNQPSAVQATYVITCGGLHSDRLAQISGCSASPRIVPFRGDYLLLKPGKAALVRGNIYPVPDPRFPFLGVHFTPRMDGSLWLGPNAVLAFAREGYGLFSFNAKDTLDALSYSGLRKLAAKFLVRGVQEFSGAIWISRTVKQLQRYVPDLRLEDVIRGPSGVRAQALDPNGNLVDDFVFDSGTEGGVGKRVLHVRNAPSPAATSSMAIARLVANEAEKKFSL